MNPPAQLPQQNLEAELRDFFVHLASLLSLPKSLGEIYGLLYASPTPLCFDDIQNNLGISKGSVSMGLKSLRELGAVHIEKQPEDRRDFYVVEQSLRRLAEAFLSQRLLPQISEGAEKITEMENLLVSNPDLPEHLHQSVNSLRTWNRKAQRILPLFRKIL